MSQSSRAAMVAAFALAAAGSAHAQGNTPADGIAQIRSELRRQAVLIDAQQREIDKLKGERDQILSEIRAGREATGSAAILTTDPVPNAVSEAAPIARATSAPGGGPTAPVGQAPSEDQRRQQQASALAAVPAQVAVLTPRGHLVIDPSIEYDRTSNDRLVFRGIEIVPGINFGVVDANRTASDTGVATLAMRYGLTSRLEVEARVPYVYRHDLVISTPAQSNQFQSPPSSNIYGHGLGDVEFDARYQLNYGAGGWPILVATSRVKPPTGRGPYDVAYDASAVAKQLPTGSGFWAAEGGLTALYPTDPAIIFASLTYLHNFSRNVNKTLGEADSALHVGKVEPGDSIGASLGFGLALNPRFSVSLGYSHNYIFSTTAFENTPGQLAAMSKSQPLQVGSLLMGWSFRLSDKLTLNNSLQFGVTSDAPDLQMVFRIPYRF